MHFTPSAVSAPGKVLLAGGYLVLDRDYSGLVFALSARIHAVSAACPHQPNRITVRSPQFAAAEWSYDISLSGVGGRAGSNGDDDHNGGYDDGGAVVMPVVAGSPKNPFVETTIRYVLSYLGASIPDFAARELPGAAITIYADNDYYSQPPTPTTPPTATAAPLPRFNSLNVPLSSAHKTGLGSSAALTTALTACLLATYSPQPLAAAAAAAAAADTPMAPETESKIHNLAQAAHCAAQGKVGSGFDVAAAVFGSCVYRRFSPAVLEAVGDAGTAAFAARLRAAVDAAWDASWGLAVLRTQLPPGLRLLMGDVDCGSSTPGMVRTLLAWRREQPHAAKALWDTLESLNRGLIALLADARAQAERSPQQYLEALKASSSGGGSSSSTSSTSSGSETLSESATLLRNISAQLASIRVNIRAMGEASGVPIEPPAQTALLDRAVAAVRGVLGGVVPGAGGYDAVVFLVTDTDDTVASLKRFLKNYRFEGTGGAVEALDTREEHKGVCWEDLSGYAL